MSDAAFADRRQRALEALTRHFVSAALQMQNAARELDDKSAPEIVVSRRLLDALKQGMAPQMVQGKASGLPSNTLQIGDVIVRSRT